MSDAAGRNSTELISAATVVDLLIAPHVCNQLYLETLLELADQVHQIRALNSSRRVLIYHSMATTNSTVRKREREYFIGYVNAFKNLELASSVDCPRLIYRDCISHGMGGVKSDNQNSADETYQAGAEILHGESTTVKN